MSFFDFDPRRPFVAGQTPESHLVEVWLNGYREALAIAADPVDGWVERYRQDDDGKILMTLKDRPATERIYGHVELKQTRF